MPDSIEVKNPIEHRDWDAWVAGIEGATVFHSSQWAKVLRDSYGYLPQYFASRRGSNGGLLVPVMEVSSPVTGKRGVSLPFSDLCKSLVPPDMSREEVRSYIFEHGSHAGWRFIEFRGGELFGPDVTPSMSFYSHHMDLCPRKEGIFESLRHSTRNSLQKAIKEGVRFSTSRSSEAMEVFYGLNCMTRKRHGLPPQPLSFFRKVHEYIISKGMGTVMEASYRGRVVAAAVCFHFAGNALMKYAAYDAHYQSVRPNNLLVWESMLWYASKGFSRLSFGRSDMNNSGLRRFKVGWNLTEQVLGYYKYDLLKNRMVGDKHAFVDWSSRFLKNVPIPFLRMAGKVLYRHMG